MCPLEAVSIGPHSVSRLALFGNSGLRIAKNEANIQLRIKLLNAAHLLAIMRLEQSFRFHDDPVPQEKVWGVFVGLLGDGVGQVELLEGELSATL
jgi:hypothetical protein